jgi:hypothetical protein
VDGKSGRPCVTKFSSGGYHECRLCDQAEEHSRLLAARLDSGTPADGSDCYCPSVAPLMCFKLIVCRATQFVLNFYSQDKNFSFQRTRIIVFCLIILACVMDER